MQWEWDPYLANPYHVGRVRLCFVTPPDATASMEPLGTNPSPNPDPNPDPNQVAAFLGGSGAGGQSVSRAFCDCRKLLPGCRMSAQLLLEAER